MEVDPIRGDPVELEVKVPRGNLEDEVIPAQLRNVVDLGAGETDGDVLPPVGGDPPVADEDAGVIDLSLNLSSEASSVAGIRDIGVEEICRKYVES